MIQLGADLVVDFLNDKRDNKKTDISYIYISESSL